MKIERYPAKNFCEMLDGLTDATYGIDTLLKKGRLPVLEGGRMAAEKFLVDEEDPESFFKNKETETAEETETKDETETAENETENEISDVTINRDKRRASRRKATAKAKRRNRRNEPYTNSIVDHGEYVIHKGNTHSWHPEWRKIDKRLRRHEGKNLCFNYEAEDVATEDWEDLELLEELEVMERQEWLRDMENFRAKQELEIWEPEDWEPEDEDENENYMETFEAMEKADRLEWLQELEDEVFGTGIERECSYYRLFLSEFNLWTLFDEWKKRREA